MITSIQSFFENLSAKQQTWLKLSFLVFFNFFLLREMLNSGYYGDDAPNSLVPGVVPFAFDSVGALTWHFQKLWFLNGRFFPLTSYGYYLFDILDTLIAYKIFLLVMVLFCVAAFSYFTFALTRSRQFAYLVAFLSPIFFQFRDFHEPILAYTALLQIVFLYTVGSLTLLVFYLRTNKYRYLSGSVLLYLCSLLTYEISFSFVLMHVVVIYFFDPSGRSFFRTVLKSLPYGVIIVIMVGLTLYIRANAVAHPSVYAINWDLPKVANTVRLQIQSTLPLTYFRGIRGVWTSSNFVRENLIFADIFTLFMVLVGLKVFYFKFDRAAFTDKRGGVFGYITVGMAFWCLPPLLISLSTRHQSQAAFGLPYLQVFIQYFGVILLTAMGILGLKRAWGKVLMVILFLIITMIHTQYNRVVVENMNQHWKYPRELMELASREVLTGQVQSGDTLILDRTYHYYNQPFFTMQTGANLVVTDNKLGPETNQNFRMSYKYLPPWGVVTFFKVQKDITEPLWSFKDESRYFFYRQVNKGWESVELDQCEKAKILSVTLSTCTK